MSEIVKLVNQNEMLSPNQVVHVMQIAHKVFFFLFFFYTEKHDNSLTLFYQNIPVLECDLDLPHKASR